MDKTYTIYGINTATDFNNGLMLTTYAITHADGIVNYEVSFYDEVDAKWLPANNEGNKNILYSILKNNDQIYNHLISKISNGASREIYIINNEVIHS